MARELIQGTLGKMAQQETGYAISNIQESLRDQYNRQLDNARKNVARLEELIDLLDKNPSLVRFIELSQMLY